jgi:hypothetical protein
MLFATWACSFRHLVVTFGFSPPRFDLARCENFWETVAVTSKKETPTTSASKTVVSTGFVFLLAIACGLVAAIFITRGVLQN